MDNIAFFEGGYSFRRITSGCAPGIYEELSALDKICVGAEGWSAGSFQSETEKDNGIVIGAYAGERLSGLICGYFAGDEGDITSVAVDPEHRRKGIGRRLIELFLRELPENTESVFLEVRSSNAGAVSLYEKCGFVRLSIRKNFYNDPAEDALVMKKRLR